MLHARKMNLLKKRVLIVIGILLIAFAMSESSLASSVDPIDQTTDTDNTIPDSHGGSKGVGQSFTAGKTGWMYDVDVFLAQSSAAEREISLTIHEGADINGTVLGVAKVSSSIVPVFPGGWVRFNFDEGIYVESNKEYSMMMETTNNDPNQVNQVTWRIYTPSAYTGGTPYYFGHWNNFNFDFAFRTYVASQQRDYSTILQLDQLTTTYGDTEEIRATLLDFQNQAVSNKRITFSLDGTVLGSSDTNGNGEAVFSYSVNTGIGDHILTALFDGDPTHIASIGSAMMTVDKRPLVVTANNATREYGTSNPVFTGAITGALSLDGMTATYATSADQASDAGNYAIEATLVDPNNKLGNYEVTKTAGSLSVTKASLSVTADGATREYGTNNPVFTGTVSGGFSSDGITATYATSADQASDVGNYAIEGSLIDPNNKLGNYEVTKTAGSLSVTKAPLTVTAHPISRWVNNGNPTLTGVVTGVLNNDDISVKYVTLAEQSSPIGNYTIETEIIDPNQRIGNYEVTSNTAKFNVYDIPKLTYVTNDTASSVIGHLGLPATDEEGRSIQWVSSNNQLVDGATGYVQRPSYPEGNKSVTLKATTTADGATYEAIYPLIIIARSNTSPGTSPVTSSETSPGISSGTSSGVSYYIETVLANGKQRVELKLDDLKKGFATIKSDSEFAEFVISKETLTHLTAISPSMKLQFITLKDEITIPIQEMAIAGDTHDLTIKIGRADTTTEFVEVKKSLGANVWSGPVVFNVNRLDDQGRNSEISAFTAYVERKIELDGQESDFATVVFWDEEKQLFTFVPAQFINENGKVTAIVKSMRNGYFFVMDRRVSFVDMQNHWAKSDIELLAAKFIVKGRSEMNFDPNGMLTRAETAALLVRALGIPLNNTEFNFSDVDGKWYEADVIAAEQAGLIKGYSDGTFRPNNRVTREELAVMLTRAITNANPSLQKDNGVLALTDVESISSWAEDSINQALNLGIIKGDQQGNFKPQAEATRAEMVTLLSRMLKLLNFI
ncbi:S-layer homology domain-containing protein [Paenibacillus sp. FSL H8-0079]|uniref:S-layer homology domain-containing protein n=1 Tax=Paenibacillus sp. FSL H8-0079 TaxID=2921375 RepID=UPI0030EBF9DD